MDKIINKTIINGIGIFLIIFVIAFLASKIFNSLPKDVAQNELHEIFRIKYTNPAVVDLCDSLARFINIKDLINILKSEDGWINSKGISNIGKKYMCGSDFCYLAPIY